MKKHKNKTHISSRQIVLTGVFTAIISIISTFPLGVELFGVPATLQTFAMAFIGYFLTIRLSLAVFGSYLLLGFIGIPVFNRFMAGPSVLFGLSGGFLFGFFFLCLFCGLGIHYSHKYKKRFFRHVTCIILGIIGLCLCHCFGTIQFALLSKRPILESFLLVSFPYLIKDIISVLMAYLFAMRLKKQFHYSSLT